MAAAHQNLRQEYSSQYIGVMKVCSEACRVAL